MIDVQINDDQLKSLIHSLGFKLFPGCKLSSEVFSNKKDLDNLYYLLHIYYTYVVTD